MIGLASGAGDFAKAAGKVGRFLLKNADNVGVYAEILKFINKNCSDLLKYLGKNDEFVEATKKVSLVKDQKMTNSEYDEISDALSKAGLDDVFKSASKAINNVSQASPFDLQATHSQTLSKKNMNKLIDDIKNNGINETIKYVEYNGQKYVVDGHHRLIASKRLGLEQVPIEIRLPQSHWL